MTTMELRESPQYVRDDEILLHYRPISGGGLLEIAGRSAEAGHKPFDDALLDYVSACLISAHKAKIIVPKDEGFGEPDETGARFLPWEDKLQDLIARRNENERRTGRLAKLAVTIVRTEPPLS